MVTFGQVYGRILYNSGNNLITAKYIPTGDFLAQLKRFGDFTLQLPEGSTAGNLTSKYAGRLTAGYLMHCLDDVRLRPKAEHRWTKNPFSMILPITPMFSDHIRRYSIALRMGGSEQKDKFLAELAAEEEGLMPREIVRKGQRIYQLWSDMPDYLRNELLAKSEAYHVGVRNDRTFEIGIIRDGLGFLLNNEITLDDIKPAYLKDLLAGLRKYVTPDNLDDFSYIAVRIKSGCSNPDFQQEFESQSLLLLGTEIEEVPNVWGEGRLEEAAVALEHDNLAKVGT